MAFYSHELGQRHCVIPFLLGAQALERAAALVCIGVVRIRGRLA